MILVTMTIDGDTIRCSNEALPLEHYWYPYAISFGTIKYQIDNIHGGYCRLAYGTITFMPEVFVAHWPPPVSIPISAHYTDTTEAAAILLFSGVIHIKSMNTTDIVYDIYNAEEYQINTLQESISYESDQIDIRNANYKWSSASGAVAVVSITDDTNSGADGTRLMIFSGAHTTPAIGTYTVLDHIITSVNIVSNGSGYSSSPSVTTQPGEGGVLSASIVPSGAYRLELSGGGDPALSAPDAIVADYIVQTASETAVLSPASWFYGDVNGIGYDTIYVRLTDGTDPDTKAGAWILAVYGLTPLPMAFGLVTFEKPVRLLDVSAGANQRYWLADIQGAAGTDWFLFDDGVDVSANVGTVADNVFELTVQPVGELTMTGTGSNTSLRSVFQWAATEMGVTIDDTYRRLVSPSINYYLTAQTYIPDFLSALAAYFTHLFYLRTGVLYLVDMLRNAGAETTTEFDFFSDNYVFNAPAKMLKSEYSYRVAGEWYDGAGGSSGVCVRESRKIISIPSNYKYGESDQDFSPPYCTGRTPIQRALHNILTILDRPQAAIKIPFGGVLQSPGRMISWVNASFPYNVSSSIYIRTVSYDFDNHEISIEGDCEVSA